VITTCEEQPDGTRLQTFSGAPFDELRPHVIQAMQGRLLIRCLCTRNALGARVKLVTKGEEE